MNWYHNGTRISPSRDIKISQSKEGVCQLEILEVFPENEGVYAAVAVNRAGEDATECALAVETHVYEPDSEIAVISEPTDDILSDEELQDGMSLVLPNIKCINSVTNSRFIIIIYDLFLLFLPQHLQAFFMFVFCLIPYFRYVYH